MGMFVIRMWFEGGVLRLLIHAIICVSLSPTHFFNRLHQTLI